MPRAYPLALQNAYRDLLERHLRRPRPEVAGSVMKIDRGRGGWVVRRRVGDRVQETRLGPDEPEVRARAERIRLENEALREWSREASRLVAQLRAGRMPVPATGSGKLLNALARSGVFEAGAVLAGTHAFGLYSLELGVELEHALAQTEDVDIAADRSVRLISADGAGLDARLSALGLRPVAGPLEARPVRWETSDGVVLDVLTPLRRGREAAVRHEGLGIHAQALPFLDFSLRDPTDAVALYREGIHVRVPAPERYALHKLIVASARAGTHRAKAGKDLAQAAALVEALAESRPWEMVMAWEEAIGRGPKWRAAIEASLDRKPEIRQSLAKALGDEAAPGPP